MIDTTQSHPSGFLYVRILGASLDKPVSSAYVKIRQGKSNTIKTDSSRASASPLWNEEFRMQLKASPERRPLALQIWKSAVIKDSLVASFSHNIKDMTPSIWTETELTETTPRDEQSPRLRIATYFEPAEYTSLLPDLERLPKFRVILQKEKYVPGEMVIGTVVLALSEQKSLKHLSACIKGRMLTTHEIYSHQNRDIIPTEYNFFRQEVTLWRPDNKQPSIIIIIIITIMAFIIIIVLNEFSGLTAGIHQFPIALQLPSNISSAQANIIACSLQGKIHYRGLKMDNKVEEFFELVHSPKRILDTEALQSI